MEASELQRMIPALQLANGLMVELTTLNDGRTREHRLEFYLWSGTKINADIYFSIVLPDSQGGRILRDRQEVQIHPSCYKFVNVVLCSFLDAHVGKLTNLNVRNNCHLIPQFLHNLLAALGGKGITKLSIRYCEDLVVPERRQELDSLFRPLLSLTMYAVDALVDDASFTEMGRLVGLAPNLQELTLSFRSGLNGFVDILSGCHSFQNLRQISLECIELGHQCQLDTLRRFFDILKSLPSLNRLSSSSSSISLEGANADFFWAQLLGLSNLHLGLKNCNIPESAAPIIHNLLVGPDCQINGLNVDYNGGEEGDGRGVVHRAFHSGIALNQSIKSLVSTTYNPHAEDARQIWIAICNMIEVNTTLTNIRLETDADTAEFEDYILDENDEIDENEVRVVQDQHYVMFFDSLQKNQTLTDVTVKSRDGFMDDTSVAAMGSYLESSTVLESFQLYCSVDLKLTAQICKSVRKSKSLKKLHINGPSTPKCFDLLVEVLAHNNNIVDARFGTSKSNRMDYYLALNRYGRKHLLDPCFPAKVVPLVFARPSKDCMQASFIYTCLRESPHLTNGIGGESPPPF